eukprot:5705584-Alexandrium_andersonii.AAC.1
MAALGAGAGAGDAAVSAAGERYAAPWATWSAHGWTQQTTAPLVAASAAERDAQLRVGSRCGIEAPAH